jgi:hypothetical protein
MGLDATLAVKRSRRAAILDCARSLQRILLAAATHARAAKTEQGRKFEDRSHGFRFLGRGAWGPAGERKK